MVPTEFKFQATLDTLQKELTQLIKQRQEIENQIAATRQTVLGLMQLRDASLDDAEPNFDDSPAGNFGKMMHELNTSVSALFIPDNLTAACRSVVQSSSQPLTAGDIKREVELLGYDFSDYKNNPISAVYAILQRLDEVRSIKRSDGKTVYEWIKRPPAGISVSGQVMVTDRPVGPVERKQKERVKTLEEGRPIVPPVPEGRPVVPPVPGLKKK
jgi:hypothetical protein